MSSVFDAIQLQRIAQAIEDGYAGGGTLTVDVTGAGDMQGATAGAAGVHGLVPAPAAGDQDKVLTGAGTWVDQSSGGGGVDYSTIEQDTGLKWIDGSEIYQITYVDTLINSVRNIDISALNANVAWIVDGFYDIGVTNVSLNEYLSNNAVAYTHINTGLNPPYIDCYCNIGGAGNYPVYVTIRYTKIGGNHED